ncbi:MAG TPA: hypothetical protein VMH90_02800, partial [Thermoplasmata archaeon]|nr:hypothetical protein [Thermoplasmata archaeon]
MSPLPRIDQMMTYDASDGYVLLYGGWSGQKGSVATETWTFDSHGWTNITANQSVSPPDIARGAMVYDAAAGYVLFRAGGMTGLYGSPSASNQTWKFAGGHWSRLSPSASPPLDYRFGMVYDAYDHEVLSFGGAGLSNVTWAFSNGSWSRITSLSGHPSPGGLIDPLMVYDSRSQHVVMIGGCHRHCNVDRTWLFQSGQWHSLRQP